MNTLSSVTVNQEIYQSLTDWIYANMNSSNPTSVILTGDFGSGKTTILRKVCVQFKKTGEDTLWIDGRMIFSLNAILRLLPNTGSCLIFIDDIDYFFFRTTVAEQLQLKKYLEQNKSLLIIGASENISINGLGNESPFVFFKILNIPPLDMNLTFGSVLSAEQKQRADYLAGFLKPTIRHAEEIYRIVKGRKGYDLLQLIERHSAQYSDRYRQMSVYSQNILNSIAEEDPQGITMARLREKTELSNNILSSYLKILRDNGIILYNVTQKGKTKYKICDLLFRKWLISESLSRFSVD